MSFQLVPLNRGAAPVITLQRPVVLIGRHVDCDARIESAKVSRRHCCIAMAYDRVILRDLGSRNGIRVNGRLVEEVRLQAGDEVAIGPILYRFEGLPTQAVGPAAPGVGAGRTPAGVSGPANFAAPAGAGRGFDDSDVDLIPLDDL